MDTRDTWLSSLTFGGYCSGVSLDSLGSRKSSEAWGSLESWEPRDAVHSWFPLVPFLSQLPIDTRKTLGSWQSWKTPDELVTLAVSSFTFPAFLPSSSWETRRPGVAHSSF